MRRMKKEMDASQMQGKLVYGLEFDPARREVKIYPLNDEMCIIMRGEKEVEQFAKNLMDLFR